MNIYHNIIETKRKEVEQKKEMLPIEDLKSFRHYHSPCNSLITSLLTAPSIGLIAEFVRRTPSTGSINETIQIGPVVESYDAHGASAISISTDETYHGGSIDDLIYCRDIVSVPIIRNDFIVDEYQVVESKAIGASAIILIAALLSAEDVRSLALYAKRIGLEVLLEINNASETDRICPEVDAVIVNNTDPDTFISDIQSSIDLASKIEADKIRISRGAIEDVQTIIKLKQHGYHGFVVGEGLLKQVDPATAFADFINYLRKDLKGDDEEY